MGKPKRQKQSATSPEQVRGTQEGPDISDDAVDPRKARRRSGRSADHILHTRTPLDTKRIARRHRQTGEKPSDA
ncbi:MAG TPA: hypothetical protein VLB73_03475 [Patescibacteria group bacterium]|nr:hypothetical protein [Patescibacteria group bacterium]